jgi:hypothetical protein
MDLLSSLSAFSVFLGIAAVGFLFMMVSLLFGEVFEHFEGGLDHDLDHGGPGFFSSRVMGVFVTAFGGFGAIATHYGLGALPASLVGVVSGVEAAAILRKAEAWKEFNDAARLQTVLEKMPAILEASTGIFGAVAAPLGNIDKVVVIDQGNGSAEHGGGGLGRFAKTSPAVVFSLLQQLEALGLNLPNVMQQLGVNAASPVSARPEPPSAPAPLAGAPRDKRD